MSQNAEMTWFAFVIMPFSEELVDFYFQKIVPTLQSVGYRVERADSTLDQRNILKDIIHNIDIADLIVADITGLNHNVMYELGVAHALGKPTVMLIQDIDQAPFDLAAYNLNPYSLKFNEIGDIVARISQIAIRHKDSQVKFSNPVTDFAPSKQKSITPTLENDAIPELSTSTKLLRNPKVFIEKITAHTQNITNLMTGLTTDIKVRSEQLSRIRTSPSANVDGAIQRLIKAINADVHIFAETASKELADIHELWQVTREAIDNLLTVINMSNIEELSALKHLGSVLEQIENSTAKSIDGMKIAKEGMNFAVSSDEDQQSKDLLTDFYDQYIFEFTVADSYLCRMISIVDELLYGHS